VGLVFLDLDGFKQVNDDHGHEAGDALLVEFAAHLRAATRAEDVVARLAGDEFCVVLDGITDRAHAADVAGQLRRRLAEDLAGSGVGVSLGVAVGPADGSDPAALLHAADLAMYADKSRRGEPAGRAAGPGRAPE
jgi:diguanylate cyclase (GGDEF)-like protein